MSASLRASVTQTRELRTHAELWHASKCVLDVGINNEKGSSWQFLSSILLSAFAFEAFLNHSGAKIICRWNEVEERLPPIKKYKALAKELKIILPDLNKRPFITIKELFDFRNNVAHGKTIMLNAASKIVDRNQLDNFLLHNSPLSSWEARIQNSEFAVRVREDIEAILTPLHEAMPEPRGLLFQFGMGSSSATTLPPEELLEP